MNSDKLIGRLQIQIQELEKALEVKKAEIERLENQDRFKSYEDVKAGETFIYKGHEYTKLRNGRAIINDYDDEFMDCPFDNVNNDYDESLIRRYINSGKFLSFLGLRNLDFGYSGDDMVILLSKEEYEENKDIIKKFDNWWWLRSGSYTYSACGVFSSGCVDIDPVYYDNGVRPSFDFQDGIEVEVVNE